MFNNCIDIRFDHCQIRGFSLIDNLARPPFQGAKQQYCCQRISLSSVFSVFRHMFARSDAYEDDIDYGQRFLSKIYHDWCTDRYGIHYWYFSHSMLSKIYETIERPSVCSSVCPIMRPQPWRAAGLLLSAVPAGDIDRQRRPTSSSGAAPRGRSTALSSKYEQCFVDRWRRMLNTDLFLICYESCCRHVCCRDVS